MKKESDDVEEEAKNKGKTSVEQNWKVERPKNQKSD